MSKKLIIILVALSLALLAGGFFVFQQIQAAQQREAYQKSSDKIADDLIGAILAKSPTRTMSYFSASLAANYSEAYWKDTIFTELKDYKGTPNRHTKQAAGATNNGLPSPYDPELKQEATQYQYDFAGTNNATYRLTFVVFRERNAWKVNELSGNYLP